MRGGAPASAVAKRERRGGLFRPVPTAGLGDFIQVHGAADFIQRPVDVGAVEESRQDILPVSQKCRRGWHPVDCDYVQPPALLTDRGLPVALLRIVFDRHIPLRWPSNPLELAVTVDT